MSYLYNIWNEESELEESELEDPEVKDPEVEDPEIEDPAVEESEWRNFSPLTLLLWFRVVLS